MKVFLKMAYLLCMILLMTFFGACGSSNHDTPTESGTETNGTETETDDSEQNGSETETNPTEDKAQGDEDPKPSTDGASEEADNDILVAYFSATGNTRKIAEKLANETGGDLFEIIPKQTYTDADLDYSNDTCRANKEQNDSKSRPEISQTVKDMKQYRVVLIGYPIWWGQEPRIIDTFMESYSFTGKTLVNFCTSGGSSIARSTGNLKAMSAGAVWKDGHRFSASASSEDIQNWMNELNILK